MIKQILTLLVCYVFMQAGSSNILWKKNNFFELLNEGTMYDFVEIYEKCDSNCSCLRHCQFLWTQSSLLGLLFSCRHPWWLCLQR